MNTVDFFYFNSLMFIIPFIVAAEFGKPIYFLAFMGILSIFGFLFCYFYNLGKESQGGKKK